MVIDQIVIELIENEYRFDAKASDKFYQGIDENMEIDNSLHSLFGVSNVRPIY